MKSAEDIADDINKMFPKASDSWMCSDLARVNENDYVSISAESDYVKADGALDRVADYYGEHRGGYPWINPELEAYADKNGLFVEWQDAGTLTLYPL